MTDLYSGPEFERAMDRRGELVNAHFLRGLTEAEQAELDRYDALLDAEEAKFYGPILAKLKEKLAVRERDGAAVWREGWGERDAHE